MKPQFAPGVRIRCETGLPFDVSVEAPDGTRLKRVSRVEWVCDSIDNAPRATIHVLTPALDVHDGNPRWVLDGRPNLAAMPLPDAVFTIEQIDAIRELWGSTVCRLAEEHARTVDTVVRYRAKFGELEEASP